MLEAFCRHLHHASRALLRNRGFSLTALFTFALCLGANVALLAVVNAVLLRPLPYTAPERLVAVYNRYPKAGVEMAGTSTLHYLERRAQIAAFAEAAAYRGGGETVGEAGAPERLETLQVTPSFFTTLGTKAALGRTFAEEEGVYGKDQVVVLSDAYWRQAYGADPEVVGKNLRLGGNRNCTILGVLPPGFGFGTSEAKLFTPLCFNDEERKADTRHSNNMSMLARLKPGVSLAAAQAQLDALNQETLKTDPYAQLVIDAGFDTRLQGLHSFFTHQVKPALLLLQAGVFCLLLIGAVNLANLLLVRAIGRTKELAIRRVLGAGPAEIARQILGETLLLSFLGGLLGLALGWLALRGLDAFGASDLPHSGEFNLDARVCLLSLAAALGVGLLLSLPVLWHSQHGQLASTLSVESRGGTTNRATHRLRHGLIITQFALAFVLLVGAGLLGLSFQRVLAVRPGFQPQNLLSAAIPLPWAPYQELEKRLSFTQSLERALLALPGVKTVGLSSSLPFTNNVSQSGIAIAGRTPQPGESLQAHYFTGVTGDFFQTLGVPLLRGRLLTSDDTAREERVCVIDEDVARRYWKDGDPLGQGLFNGPPTDPKEVFTIVGIVGAIKQRDLADARATGAIYVPYRHSPSFFIYVTLRSDLAPEALAKELRKTVLGIDPELPVEQMLSMEARIEQSLKTRRSPLLLTALFATVALALAGLGLYGVLAYTVAQRRREIGIRLALGAVPEQIRALFLWQGLRLVLLGLSLGSLGAFFGGRALSSLLYGVQAHDPLVLACTASTLAAIAFCACLLPSTLAAKVPPLEALRAD